MCVFGRALGGERVFEVQQTLEGSISAVGKKRVLLDHQNKWGDQILWEFHRLSTTFNIVPNAENLKKTTRNTLTKVIVDLFSETEAR